MIVGKCLCGEIEFEAEEIPGLVFNCHCSRCRRAHGAAYATQVLANKSSLKFKRGKENLSEYNTNLVTRAFCSACGSRLMNYDKADLNYLSISLTAVVNNNGLKPIGECYAKEKASFVRLDDEIDHFEKLPPNLFE